MRKHFPIENVELNVNAHMYVCTYVMFEPLTFLCSKGVKMFSTSAHIFYVSATPDHYNSRTAAIRNGDIVDPRM